MPTMRICPNCGIAVSMSETALGAAGRCRSCGAVLPATSGHPADITATTPTALAGKPPVVSAAPNPFADVAPPAFQTPYFSPWQPDRNRALAKVKGPAILLIASGVVLLLCGIAGVVAIPFVLTQATGEDLVVGLMFSGIAAAAGLASGPLTIWGGARMLALRSYGLAMTAVIVSAACALLTCWPAALVFIWPLAILLDAEVKASFDRPDPNSKLASG